MKQKLELLMPAGSMEKLKFAFAYGADAVYVGVPMFSLRARTNTFTIETLKEAVNYVRNLPKNKKIYFTANIYAHNIKIKPFIAQFKKMVEMKPDAFIMADPGLIYLVRKEFPNLEIHLSVQANNTNWAQVEFWKLNGIKRVILSREISIKEMKEIHEKVPDIELEAFIHGAICMAYSGRCLISNYLSNRDPNQGTCSHSCRWEYKVFKDNKTEKETENGENNEYKELTGNFYLEEKEKIGELMEIDEDEYGTYLMNSRDLCAIDYMKDLVDAGIISFKVEGRNKTVNYLASVGKSYREAIDSIEKGEEYDSKKLAEELFSVSNRGYIPGFLAGNLGANAQFYEKNGGYQTKIFLGILRDYDEKEKLVRVEVKNRFNLGDEIEIITPDFVKIKKIEKIYKTGLNHGIKENGFTFDYKCIFNREKAELVDSAHGGGYEVWIDLDYNPGGFAIIRKSC